MINLFHPKAEPWITRFLNEHAERVTLLAAPEFVTRLQAATRDWKIDPGFAFQIKGFPTAAAELESDRLYVVADPAGERARLQALSQAFAEHRFVGLGEHLLPALVARAGQAVFQPMTGLAMPQRIVLVFAAPRTGSSLLSDLLSDLGQGDVREHLREPIVTALHSGYAFNRRAALRNFLGLSQRGGVFGTKLISHFFEDWVHGPGEIGMVHEVCAGIPLKVITLDRADTVAQMASGELAAQRGVWHITDEASAEAVRKSAAPVFNFPRLLSRYFQYRKQSAVIDFAQKAFPDHLALEYGADIEAGDLAALAAKVCGYLDLPAPEADRFARAGSRKRIANDQNASLVARFRKSWEHHFFGQP